MIHENKEKNEFPVHFCNRLPIRKDGDVNAELLGAFAYTVLSNPADVSLMHEQLEKMKKHDVMISNHLKEIYQPAFMLDSIIGSSPAIEEMRSFIKKNCSKQLNRYHYRRNRHRQRTCCWCYS